MLHFETKAETFYWNILLQCNRFKQKLMAWNLLVILWTVGFGLAKDCELTIIGKGVRHRTSSRMSMEKRSFHWSQGPQQHQSQRLRRSSWDWFDYCAGVVGHSEQDSSRSENPWTPEWPKYSGSSMNSSEGSKLVLVFNSMRLRVKRPWEEALGLNWSLGVPWVTTTVAA